MTTELGDQYKTDENLRRRQGLFQFVVPASEPQPELTSVFTWAPDAVVLDVGCGNGLWAQAALHVTPHASIFGLDASPGMARIFSERVRAPAVAADITALPLRDGSADAVLALWMLYHVPDKDTALREVARVLRRDGFFIAATNSADDGTLGSIYRSAAEQVLGHPVAAWGPTLDFTVENGAEILSTQFRDVEAWNIDTWFELDRVDPLLGVVESMKDAILARNPRLDFDEFLEAVTGTAREALDGGPIRFVRRSGFFRASRPA